MNQLSGSSTVTFTLPKAADQPAAPILFLRVHLKHIDPVQEVLSREVMDVAFNSLGQILDFYRHQRDPLSVKLIDWILKVLRNDQFKEKFDENYVKSLVKRIHTLSQEILINDLDTAFLEEPLMVGDLIWEKWMWDDFNRCSPQPPQDVRIHRFAAEIIRWRNKLPIEQVNPTIEITDPDYKPLQDILPPDTSPMLVRELCTAHYDDVSKEKKIANYCKLMSTAHKIKEFLAHQEQTNDEAEECRALWEKARINIAAQAELAESEARAHTVRMRESINNIAQAHQQTVQILDGLIVNLRDSQRQLTARLDASENRISLQEAQIWQLRVELATQWRAIHSVQKKANKKRRLI